MLRIDKDEKKLVRLKKSALAEADHWERELLGLTHGGVPGGAAAYRFRQGADGGRQCQRGAQRDPAILWGSMQCGDRSALC
jgi:hypothetical protein